MSDVKGKSEMHGCIVCGKLHSLVVAYDANGKYINSKVMSAGGKVVKGVKRPLVACESHSEAEIERAVDKVYGEGIWDPE